MDNSTPDMSVLLVQYLDGELDAEEKASLEQRLEKDPSLQQELESLKQTREAIRLFGLQQQVSGIHHQMMSQMRAPVRKMSNARRVIRYSVAVAASVILIAGTIMIYNFYNLSSDKVFSSHYQSYDLGTVRGDSVQETVLEKNYREKNFKGVTVLGEKLEPLSIQNIFLVGMAWLELGNNSKAIDQYKKVIQLNEKDGTRLEKDEAEYYLCLAYIRNRDYDLALELMHSIQDDPHHLYREKITNRFLRQVKILKWR